MTPAWTRGTWILHSLLALLVVGQLLSMLLHQNLANGSAFAYGAMVYHKYAGMLAFLVCLSFLLYRALSRTQRLLDWFPWLTRKGWQAIVADLCFLLRAKLVERREGGGLAGTVHGLGMLLVLGLSASGTAFFVCQALGYGSLAHRLIALHTSYAFLVWWYLGGHVLMALLHQLTPRRHRVEC